MEAQVEVVSGVSFFVTGGTVPPSSPSYVERAADRELFEALMAGEYSYVLNSRQMGKSSLAVRTISRMKRAGVRTGFVDFTRLGGVNVSPDQWYSGLVLETGRSLGLRTEASKFLRDQHDASPCQRYLAFLQDVVLTEVEAPVVILIDEIDAVRSLPFSTDELFAGIRQLYNGRASEPALNRLTLCLLGAALPGDLIRDPRTTPFNIGKRIELKDFSANEVEAFAKGIDSPNASRLVSRVFFWTGGHPFLTQTLCAELAADPSKPVDELVQHKYLDARARESDTNLADVAHRILGSGDPDCSQKQTADILAQYARLLKHGIPDDESNPGAARIKMSGVARLEGGRLVIRNRVYREVFGKDWIRDTMPGQEKRRQNRAFWLGVSRTAAISLTVLAFVGYLAWNNARLADSANRALAAAQYEAYVSSVGSMPELWREGNTARIEQILDATESSKYRGWEWGYWRRLVDPGQVRTDVFAHASRPCLSPDGHYLAAFSIDTILIANAHNFRILRKLPFKSDNALVLWATNDRLIVASYTFSTPSVVVSAQDGKVLSTLGKIYFGLAKGCVSTDGKLALGYMLRDDFLEPVRVDLLSGNSTPIGQYHTNNAAPFDRAFSRDGKLAAIAIDLRVAAKPKRVVEILDARSWKLVRELPITSPLRGLSFSPDGQMLATADSGGDVSLWDWRRRVKLSTVSGRKSGVDCAQFSEDGRMLAATGDDRQLVIYRVQDGKITQLGAYIGVQDADFQRASHTLLATYKTTRIVNADQLGSDPPVDFGPGAASNVAWSGDNFRSDISGEVKEVSLGTKPSTRVVGKAVSLTYMASGDGLETTYDANGAYLFDRATNATLLRFPSSYGKYVFAARAEGAHAVFVSPTVSQFVELWDFQTRRPIARFDAPKGVSAWDVSLDRQKLAISQNDGSVRLFDTRKASLLWSSAVNDGPTTSLQFSLDGKLLLTAGRDDEAACVVNASTGTVLKRLEGHTGSVNFAVCSPDGKRIATCGFDKTVKIWDSATGRELVNLGPFDNYFREVRFSQDGFRLFGIQDSRVTIWSSAPP